MNMHLSGEVCYVFGLVTNLLERIFEDRIYWAPLNINAPSIEDSVRSIRVTGIIHQTSLGYGHRVDATVSVSRSTNANGETLFTPQKAVIKIKSEHDRLGINKTFLFDENNLAQLGLFKSAVEKH
ncbi:MAG: hypothetical protein HYT27_01920 [Parcubacteria group bacterium]|nr:hypothetical protein [Parcubacteria group bacterium]